VDHEKTGLVIDDTPENLSAAVLRLVGNPDRVREMGTAGRAKALKAFRIEDQVATIENLYRQLLVSSALHRTKKGRIHGPVELGTREELHNRHPD
ncbi:MAG: glycosyltransferase, partial [Fidelibacterota bacterium]